MKLELVKKPAEYHRTLGKNHTIARVFTLWSQDAEDLGDVWREGLKEQEWGLDKNHHRTTYHLYQYQVPRDKLEDWKKLLQELNSIEAQKSRRYDRRFKCVCGQTCQSENRLILHQGTVHGIDLPKVEPIRRRIHNQHRPVELSPYEELSHHFFRFSDQEAGLGR